MKKKIIFTITFIYIFTINTVFSFENKILFKINNEIITSVDIFFEAEYLKLLNKNLENLDNEKIFEISKNSLIREKIKIIELSKYTDNFNIDQKYYNLIMRDFLKKLDFESIDKFKKYINEKDIDIQTIEKKIQIELLWNKLILDKFSKNVKIDQNEIENSIKKKKIQKEYLLSEIVFDIKENETFEEKLNSILKTSNEQNFSEAALIYSLSDTSNNGGKLGWIKDGILSKQIREELTIRNIGEITNPITIPGGFLILYVENIKEIEIKIDIEKEIKNIIEKKTNSQLNQISNVYLNKIKKKYSNK